MITKLRNRIGFIISPPLVLISERKEERLVPMSRPSTNKNRGGVCPLDHSERQRPRQRPHANRISPQLREARLLSSLRSGFLLEAIISVRSVKPRSWYARRCSAVATS